MYYNRNKHEVEEGEDEETRINFIQTTKNKNKMTIAWLFSFEREEKKWKYNVKLMVTSEACERGEWVGGRVRVDGWALLSLSKVNAESESVLMNSLDL